MSYDLGLEIDAGNGLIMIGDSHNYTCNLGDFFEWVLGKRLPAFNGLDANELGNAIEHAMSKISRVSKNELVKYEPENGWGSVLGATAFLARVGIACARAPLAKVWVN